MRPPRRLLILLTLTTVVLLAVTPAVRAGSALAQLAASFADQVVAAAHGQPVEIGEPEDRTGAALGADFSALLEARLAGRVRMGPGGRRIEPVLSRAGARLVVSARVVAGGQLVDVLSASSAADGEALPIVPTRAPAGQAPVEVTSSTLTAPLRRTPLDLAFLGAERLAVLMPDEVDVYRFDGPTLALDARYALPAPDQPVRLPGGVLSVGEGEDAFWVMTSGRDQVLLLALEGRRLVERQTASALPWPGAPAGLRFRLGTNLIDASIAGLPAAPLLHVDRAGVGVSAEGRLLRAGADASDTPRVGSTAVTLWPGLLAASGGDAPASTDTLLLLSPSPVRQVGSLQVEGVIRAMAARRTPGGARVVAALETPDGSPLLVLEVRPAP